MAYRNATYFGFDGLGQSDPSRSDFRYYAIVQKWDTQRNIDFKFVNSHEKASSVRNTSKRSTLERSIRERMRASKNMVIILSDETRKQGSMLSYEIEKAVDSNGLPLIIAHTGFDVILRPEDLAFRWPNVLNHRIQNNTANAIHIPFKREAILDAISQFTVSSKNLFGGLNYYARQTQINWGYFGS